MNLKGIIELLELNITLANNDGSWSGKAFIHKSILPNNNKVENLILRLGLLAPKII